MLTRKKYARKNIFYHLAVSQFAFSDVIRTCMRAHAYIISHADDKVKELF